MFSNNSQRPRLLFSSLAHPMGIWKLCPQSISFHYVECFEFGCLYSSKFDEFYSSQLKQSLLIFGATVGFVRKHKCCCGCIGFGCSCSFVLFQILIDSNSGLRNGFQLVISVHHRARLTNHLLASHDVNQNVPQLHHNDEEIECCVLQASYC